ncbi:MAG: nuclear transport factor 2 family protein [Deltaproteobacteria bacterium]|nr:nuclear transport factor 2 family protein [Deltaproteobacteria bacterium]
MEENERIIKEFIEAWSRLDAEELLTYFTEDAIYHNMPAQPVSGKETIGNFIRGFISGWTSTQWDILHIVSKEDVVVAERVDRTKAGDKSIDLPCVGVFEMENGKIKVWRDYFDMGTYMKAFQ